MARKKVANRLRQIGDDKPSALPPMPGRTSESQLVELGLFVSTTVIGTLVLVAFSLFFGIRAIENHLETTAAQAIERHVAVAIEEGAIPPESVAEVTVEASGVNVSLRGTVSDESQIEAIPALVAQIEGVGTVTPEIEYLPPLVFEEVAIVAAPISITWVNRQATAVGEVSDDTNRSAFMDTLLGYFPNGVDGDGLTVREGAPSERDWLSKILTLVQIGADSLSEGEIFVNADERVVQMTGEYETRQERRDARDAIDGVISETTFVFVSGLSIPEPPAFTPEDVVELQENLDDLIEGKVVEFELNSDVLTAVGAALLDEIIEALVMFPNVPIEIGGHTDSQGDALENLDLSERRAQTAFDYLVANGQDPERFVVVGYGEDVPVASNETTDGRARNRRIEFKALGE
jgi:OOP family OmpA-OmpF porin